jgi:hypothetical protein
VGKKKPDRNCNVSSGGMVGRRWMFDSRSREEGRTAVRRIIAAGSFFGRKENGKDYFVLERFKIFINCRFGYIIYR